jgi:hypothetical protein
MKVINFNTAIVNLDGAVMRQGQNDLLVKDIVANTMCVAKAKTGEAVRQLNLALEIYKAKEPMKLEDADVKFIKDILNTADLSTLVLGQIMKLLDVPETK